MDLRDSLVLRAQSGNAEAFTEIYLKYRGMVAHLAFNITGSQQDLEDVIQETFLQVHRSIRSFQGGSKFSTWLYRLTINVAMQYVRQHRKASYLARPLDEMRNLCDASPSPETSAYEQERRQILMGALEKISPRKRIVFILHELQGVEAKEIARILRIPTLTVRTRLFYARRAIYRALMKNPLFDKNIEPGGNQ